MNLINIAFLFGLFTMPVVVAAGATSTNIDFTGYGTGPITTFGSNATNTPDIEVSFSTQLTSDSMYGYDNYGDLGGVAYASADDHYAKITFTPINGTSVTINSFQLAAYAGEYYFGQTVYISDLVGNVIWSQPGTVGGNGHNNYAPVITSIGPISIVFGPSWNIGINNIDFSQIDAVPEPEAWTLMIGGFVFIGAAMRRRSTRMMIAA